MMQEKLGIQVKISQCLHLASLLSREQESKIKCTNTYVIPHVSMGGATQLSTLMKNSERIQAVWPGEASRRK